MLLLEIFIKSSFTDHGVSTREMYAFRVRWWWRPSIVLRYLVKFFHQEEDPPIAEQITEKMVNLDGLNIVRKLMGYAVYPNDGKSLRKRLNVLMLVGCMKSKT